MNAKSVKITLLICLVLCLSLAFFIAKAETRKILDIKHWQTKNDADVYFVKTNGLPIIDLMLAFNAGSARDGSNPGIAYASNHMLNQGTNKLNTDQIAEQFDELGVQYSTSVTRDMAVVHLRSLTENSILKPALTLFSNVVSDANFPANSLQREKQITLAKIKAGQQQPATLASNAFYHALYKPHAYAHPVIGTLDSVAKLNQAALKQFYKQYYVAKNLTLIIVGNIKQAQAKRIAKQITSNLPKGKAAFSKTISVGNKKQVSEAIHFPVNQTQIRLGQVGITRHDPDYFPLLVGNHILGGGSMTSRLHHEIREKRGLTYSVYSYFFPLAEKGPFLISLSTRNNKSEQAVKLVKQTLNTFIKNGPTDKELKAAKKYLIGSFPLRLDSNEAIAKNVLVIGFYHLPLNYLDMFREKISAVNSDQIRAAFKRHLNPNKMVMVSVGGNNVS